MPPIVCARCGEKKTACDFVSKKKSARATKNCLACRNKNNSHVSSGFLLRNTVCSNEMQYSRSRSAILTLRSFVAHPSSGDARQKRAPGDAGLPPARDRVGTRSVSPGRIQQPPVAGSSIGENGSEPYVVLGTPLPATQQSSSLARVVTLSPATQVKTDPTASHSDPASTRRNTTRMDYSYLTAKFHKGGRVSQDDLSTAGARVKLASIQRDHRSRRRAGEAVSLTPPVSQLGISQGAEPAKKGIHACAVVYSSSFGLTKEDRRESRPTTSGYTPRRSYHIER